MKSSVTIKTLIYIILFAFFPTSNSLSTSSTLVMSSMQPNALLKIPGLRQKFCALRHGQSMANLSKIISSDPSISTVQHGLSDLGKTQASEAGALLSNQLKNEHSKAAIFSSDFKRARETAELVAEAMKQNGISLYKDDVILETRLRERFFGSLNGGLDDKYNDVWKVDAIDPSHNEFGVESVNDVLKRTTNLVLELDEELSKEYGECLCLLVAHGDVLQILQTGFDKIDGSLHRTLPHLETAAPRHLELKLTD